MPDTTVSLRVATGSARHDHALAGRLVTDVRARGHEAGVDARSVWIKASAPATMAVVGTGDTASPENASVQVARADPHADSRTVLDELERRGLLPDAAVYDEDEEAAVARRLEELGYLG